MGRQNSWYRAPVGCRLKFSIIDNTLTVCFDLNIDAAVATFRYEVTTSEIAVGVPLQRLAVGECRHRCGVRHEECLTSHVLWVHLDNNVYYFFTHVDHCVQAPTQMHKINMYYSVRVFYIHSTFRIILSSMNSDPILIYSILR